MTILFKLKISKSLEKIENWFKQKQNENIRKIGKLFYDTDLL